MGPAHVRTVAVSRNIELSHLALLFAITGAACPIVWTNGRKALSVTPPSQLTRLSSLVILGTLTTAALRKAVLAVSAAHPGDFPAEYVLVFGAGLTILLFIVYVPSSQRLKERAQEIVDNKFPVPSVLDRDWQEQMQRRRDLATILKIDETDRDLIQTTLTIGGPLITTIISLLIPAG